MTFGEQLNEYMIQVGCMAKDLAAASGVAESQLSRWRSGERIPNADQAPRLAAGLDALARERGVALDEETVKEALAAALYVETPDYDRIIRNFDALLDALDIRASELARAMNYDSSYLSRIRTGQRRPADIETFVQAVCRFAVRKADSEENRAAVAAMTGTDAETLRDPEVMLRALTEWMYGGTPDAQDSVGDFLKKLDEFNLDEYIRAIHFDKMKAPTAPFQLPTSRDYYGVREMMDGELAFLRATVLSRVTEPVFMYSEMPMEEKAADAEFPKKWMFGMAMMLKRGLHLDMIHRIDRPFREMMLGLESWIPMYMTGQISPWYLKNPGGGPFLHLLWVSGAAALSGEAITGHYAEGRYHLTKNREALGYYQIRANALLKKASPLMDIYREDREAQFQAFLRTAADKGLAPQLLNTPAFQNITIRICHERWAAVSKEKAPHIHFVIRLPKLVSAIENFSPPVVEKP